jgi:Rod binding domain-containing protein
MSISPPSDIVLDVARAADPARYTQAAAKLGAPGAAEAFSEALDAAGSADAATIGNKVAVPRPKTDATADKAAETYRQFEAMALSNMLESSMTGDNDAFFGEGVAGSTWKSLLVEQIAKEMAKTGGIGIATQLARGAHLAMASAEGGSAPAAGSMLVDHVERGFLRALEPDESRGDEAGKTRL